MVLIMRFFSYLLFLVIVLSCSGISKKPSFENRSLFSDADSWISKNLSPEELAIFPDTELKQIIIRGYYYPENSERVKEIEKELREDGFLKEGETLKEKYPEELEKGKERYEHETAKYCYKAVKIEDRKNCYHNDNLRVRLYDREGKMIAEDCLRLENPEKYDEGGRFSEEYLREENAPDYFGPPRRLVTPEAGILKSRVVIAYIPYDKNSYENRIVRLEGKKEIILKSSSGSLLVTKSKLIELYYTNHISRYRGFGHDYDAESQCHTSLRPR